jgi:hypothetical protein
LKLQRLQNKVIRTTDHFPRRTPTRELHMALKITYVYDFATKLCMQQAKVVQNHEDVNICNNGQGNALQRKYTRLKLGGGQVYGNSSV